LIDDFDQSDQGVRSSRSTDRASGVIEQSITPAESLNPIVRLSDDQDHQGIDHLDDHSIGLITPKQRSRDGDDHGDHLRNAQ
jgi:hypothetical protein